MESLSEPGGICIAAAVYEQVKNKLALKYEDLGKQTVKNIAEPVRVWRVMIDEPAIFAANGRDEAGVETPRRGVSTLQKRRVGTAHLSRTVLVAAGLLIVGGVVTLLYPSLQKIRTLHFALRNQDEASALPLPDKPSIVVLPFTNMSSDPEQEYFSDGITEDLTSDLSKISSLFVIARNSAFTYKGKATKVQDISKELGVRYVWEKATELDPNYAQAYAGVAMTHLTDWSFPWSQDPQQSLEQAFEMAQRAITLDDSLPIAHSTLGNVLLWKKQHDHAIAEEERAIALDPNFASAYAWLGFILGSAGQPEEALKAVEKAMRLNPRYPSFYLMVSGRASALAGRYEKAITDLRSALALTAYRPATFWLSFIANQVRRRRLGPK